MVTPPLPALYNIAPTTSPPPTPSPENPKLRATAVAFESMVLSQMLAPMFEALDTEGMGGGGEGERMFRPMLVERYADAMTRSGGIGVADAVLRELVRLQEGANLGADR
jgi:peptidoglycan hydrolase FlgJ